MLTDDGKTRRWKVQGDRNVKTGNSKYLRQRLPSGTRLLHGTAKLLPIVRLRRPPFYAHMARDDAILAIRHVTRPVIDHSAGEDLVSAFIEVSDVNALHDS